MKVGIYILPEGIELRTLVPYLECSYAFPVFTGPPLKRSGQPLEIRRLYRLRDVRAMLSFCGRYKHSAAQMGSRDSTSGHFQ